MRQLWKGAIDSQAVCRRTSHTGKHREVLQDFPCPQKARGVLTKFPVSTKSTGRSYRISRVHKKHREVLQDFPCPQRGQGGLTGLSVSTKSTGRFYKMPRVQKSTGRSYRNSRVHRKHGEVLQDFPCPQKAQKGLTRFRVST